MVVFQRPLSQPRSCYYPACVMVSVQVPLAVLAIVYVPPALVHAPELAKLTGQPGGGRCHYREAAALYHLRRSRRRYVDRLARWSCIR